MFQLFRPESYLDTVYDLPLDYLADQGIRGIILDLDNTLVAWNDPNPTEKLMRWFDELSERNFRVCILSNNTMQRVKLFAERAGVQALAHASKPRRGAYRTAMQMMNTGPDETIAVGDQLFTDVLGGNRSGIRTYLVRPVAQREFIGTQLVRNVERLILSQMDIPGRSPGM